MAIGKIKIQLTELGILANEMEELIDEVRTIDAKIERDRGIVVDIETSVRFNPERVLQMARFKLMRAQETLVQLERPYTIRRHRARHEKEAADIPTMVQEQTRILQRSLRSLNELKDTLQDVFR